MNPDFERALQRITTLEVQRRLLRDALWARSGIDRPVSAPFINPVMYGGGGVAPTNTIAAGAVTQNRDWAYTYESTSLNKETTLSATSTANLIAEKNTLSGPRSLDPQVDYVNVYTRLAGSTNEDWYLVSSVANPTSGTWSVEDNSSISAYLGNGQPNSFTIPLLQACGAGFRFRRAKVRFESALAANSSAYWIFQLGLIRSQQTAPYWLTPEQRTNTVGFLPAALYPIPYYATTTGGSATKDLNQLMNEDDLLVFRGRAVGAVAPLPAGSVLATISEPEPEV